MALVTSLERDMISMRQAIARLSSIKLGPNSTPTFGSLTITTPLSVANGGTGASSLTDHSLLVGSGTDAITAIGAATNGQLPIGSTGNDPQLNTLTEGTGISISNGAGSITISFDGSEPLTLSDLTLTGTLNCRQINPDDHDTYNIGEVGRRWHTIHVYQVEGALGHFDYLTLDTSQGVTGLTTSDHPTFDYINLSTTQGVTGLTVSDSPIFNNLTLTGTANIRQLNPDNDDTYDIGESGRRWQDIFLSGTATFSGIQTYAIDLSGGTWTAGLNLEANCKIYSNGTRIGEFDSTNYNVFWGTEAFENDRGQYNVGIGYQAGYYNDTTGGVSRGDLNIYIGYKAGYGFSGPETPNIGTNNLAIGYAALYNNQSGNYCVALGVDALNKNTTGSNNMGIGTAALGSNTTGGNCVAVGVNTLYSNTTGSNQTGIGYYALYTAGTGSTGNTAIGSSAGRSVSTGDDSVYIGVSAGYYNQTGSYNVIVGRNAARGASGNSNSNNSIFGYAGGYSLTTGSSNIFLGYKSGYNQLTNSNLLIIDNQDRGSTALEATNSLLYGLFDAAPANQYLKINGNLYLSLDSRKIYLGTGNDAEIYYDGTNLVLDPDVVGTGVVSINGGLTCTHASQGTLATFQSTGSAASSEVLISGDEFLYIEMKAHNSTGAYCGFRGNRARGTTAEPTAVQSGDEMAMFYARGYDGDSFEDSAGIVCVVDGNVSDEIVPGRIDFYTQDIAGGAWNKRGTIKTTGYWGINTSAPDRQLEINNSSGNCLRLTYNDENGSAANYVDYLVSSAGKATITPSGGVLYLNGSLGIGTASPAEEIQIDSAAPGILLHETDAGANEGEWRTTASGGTLYLQSRADSNGSGSTWLQVERTGTTIDSIYLPNGNIHIGDTTAAITKIEVTASEPYITLHNPTDEDSNGGRESRLIARGEQSGSEESVLGYLEFAHDGAADDEKGLCRILINDGDDGTTPSLTPFKVDSAGATYLGDGGTTNYTAFATDGELTLHGTARVTTSKWMPAGAVRGVGANPASETLNAAGFVILEFADAADNYAQANIKIPEDMDVSADSYVCLGWSVPNTSANMTWGYGYLITAGDEDTEGAATTGTQQVTSSATADGLNDDIIITISGGTISSSDICLHLYIYRDVSEDTYGNPVDLHGIAFKYTSNKLGTAT